MSSEELSQAGVLSYRAPIRAADSACIFIAGSAPETSPGRDQRVKKTLHGGSPLQVFSVGGVSLIEKPLQYRSRDSERLLAVGTVVDNAAGDVVERKVLQAVLTVGTGNGCSWDDSSELGHELWFEVEVEIPQSQIALRC